MEEALDRTSKLLDQGFREQAPRMILIHGLGKGILRDAIRQSLSQAPYPVSFRPGRRAEGGAASPSWTSNRQGFEIDRSEGPAGDGRLLKRVALETD